MSEQCWEEPTEIKPDGSVWSSTLCLSLFDVNVSLPQFVWFGHFVVGLSNCQPFVVSKQHGGRMLLSTVRQDPT